MRFVEAVRVLLFLVVVSLIYVHAVVAVVRFIRKRSWRPGFAHLIDISTLCLVVVGTGCIGYGYLIEPFKLTITHIQITSPKIASSTANIRIVHLSDVHSDTTPRLEPIVPQAVAAEKPDAIVLSGDYYNSREALPVFRKMLVELTRIAPTFVVRGNWETDFYPDTRPFAGTEALELDGKAVRIWLRGSPIWMAGLAAHNEVSLRSMLREVAPGEFVLLIYHYPDSIYEAAALDVDLYCAGHTHGGQVRLPFYGALLTLSKFGKRFEAGLYRERNTWMYVNRGIGLGGGIWPKVRFLAPPELTTIDIRPAT